MPTIVGILTFMSRINFLLSWVEHEESFITMDPVSSLHLFTILCMWQQILRDYLGLSKPLLDTSVISINILCACSNDGCSLDCTILYYCMSRLFFPVLSFPEGERNILTQERGYPNMWCLKRYQIVVTCWLKKICSMTKTRNKMSQSMHDIFDIHVPHIL